MAFEKIFQGSPTANDVVTSASPQNPQLGVNVDDDSLWVNSGQGWSEVGGTAGAVTTTGSPASGNLTKFSGAATITNGNLTGDVTTSNTLATTLATVNSNVGSFTNANITVNAKGLVTAAANGSSGGSTPPSLAQPFGLATGSAAPTLSVTINVPAGATIFVSMEGGSGGSDTVTDSQGNTYTDGSSVGSPVISAHASIATHTGSTVITGTFGITPAGVCSMIVGIFQNVTSIQSVGNTGPTSGRALIVTAISVGGSGQPSGAAVINGYAANIWGYDATFNNFGHHFAFYTIEPCADNNTLTNISPGLSASGTTCAVFNY